MDRTAISANLPETLYFIGFSACFNQHHSGSFSVGISWNQGYFVEESPISWKTPAHEKSLTGISPDQALTSPTNKHSSKP
jgi:hypothetical protein